MAKVFVGLLGGALAALALVGELRQALLQAALDGRLPVCVRCYVDTSRRRRVDGVEATSCAVDAAARESICDHGRRKTRHSSMSISPEPSSSSTSSAFLRRGGWRRNCRFSSPQDFLRVSGDECPREPRKLTRRTPLIFLHGLDDLGRRQRAAAVLVDELEALRAALRNSPVNSAISFAAALRCASRAAARCASLLDSAVSIASSHSESENSPSLSVSIWASAESRARERADTGGFCCRSS